MCRAYTKEEIRDLFLNCIRIQVHRWSKVEGEAVKDQLSGLAHSILSLIDGTSDLPALELSVCSEAINDKQYNIENRENWFESNVIFNDDVMLHKLFYNQKQ